MLFCNTASSGKYDLMHLISLEMSTGGSEPKKSRRFILLQNCPKLRIDNLKTVRKKNSHKYITLTRISYSSSIG